MTLYRPIGAAAVGFGFVSLIAGGTVLWGPDSVRDAAGDIVLPVVWFNVLSGMAYVVAGLGIFFRRQWARPLATLLVVAISLMLLFFVAGALTGAPWEPRTLGALLVRLVFWLVARHAAAIRPRGADV